MFGTSIRCVCLGAVTLLAGCATLLPALPPTSAEPSYAHANKPPASLAVVLSSGAMRGFAHIGVLRELRANGLTPDLIVGTSAGAIVGALMASGITDAELDAAVNNMTPSMFIDWTIPKLGLLRGSSIHEFVDRQVKHHLIETFPTRFAAVALDGQRVCLQIFNAGDPGKAAQASSSIPVVLTPSTINGRHYLDGGLVSPLPVRVARALGAERVIAVDVTMDPAERGFYNILEAFWRTTMVTHWALAVNERMDADFVLRPTLPPEFRISFGNRQQIIAAGAASVRAALPELREALARPALAAPGSVHPALAAMLCPEIRKARNGD